MILLKEEVLEMVVGGPRGHRGQKGRDWTTGKGWSNGDRWDPLDQGDSQEGTDYPPLGSTYFHGAGNTPYIQCKLEYHWHGKLSALFRRITESCDAISTKCESKHGRTPKYDREKSVASGPGFRAISGKYMTKGI